MTSGTVEVTTEQAEKQVEVDNRDEFSIQVKSEFVLSEPSPVITNNNSSNSTNKGDTIIIKDAHRPSAEQQDSRSLSNGGSKNKKRRGRNKKRPRDEKVDNKVKACASVVKGETCPWGVEQCRYSHDLKGLAASREADIVPVLPAFLLNNNNGDDVYKRCTYEVCPNYELRGRCDHGITCRFGASHCDLESGDSKVNVEVSTAFSQLLNNKLETANGISRDIQNQLRKHQYPFITPRAKFVKAAAKKERSQADEKNYDTVITPALPAKERSKKIDFSGKVYVAPLTTVGNLPFRRICKQFGADITCGEMAVATNLLEGQASEWALLKRHHTEDVFGVQIAGGFPDQMTRVCELIDAQCDLDFVDLNLGCPIDIICNKGAGAKLMLQHDKLKGILKGVNDALSCPFTIKMRTGWSDHEPTAHKLVHKIQSWELPGINALMIHGRSRLQRYSKLANWDYISQVAQTAFDENLPKIPIIGNGDVFSYTDYEEKVQREGINATAMLARGAIIKPWLPTEIKERRHWDISATERLDMLKDFTRYGLEHWGSDQQGVNNTRRFLLEFLSFLHRYVPVGLLEVLPQQMNHRPPIHLCGRSDLETLFMSKHCADWIKISEMLLGKVPDGFEFQPKHKANGY